MLEVSFPIGAAIRGTTSAGGLPLFLGIEPGHHPVHHRLQFGDARPALPGLGVGAKGIVRHDQPVIGKAAFGDVILVGRTAGQCRRALNILLLGAFQL